VNIILNDALRAFIDPLAEHEYAALERSLLAEGCRDALVLWRETLIDGHNRYAICQKHNIPFKTVQNDRFASIEEVMLWMIDNHLARRSVSDFQRGMLALRKKELVAARLAEQPVSDGRGDDAAPVVVGEALKTREDVAKAARVSNNTISQIERIQKSAAPELVEAVRSGAVSINAAATIASLPPEEQVSAVAGGRKALQEAARQVREKRAPARKGDSDVAPEPDVRTAAAAALAGAEVASASVPDPALTGAADAAMVERLRAEVERLQAENAALKARLASLAAAPSGSAPPWE
jgi:hypothetical protein